MVRGRPCCTGVPSLVNVDPEQIQRARAAAGCLGQTVLGFRDFLLKGKASRKTCWLHLLEMIHFG